MGTATLVSQEIEEGQRLIDALNAAGLSVDSALWIYAPEPESWRLMLTSPLYDKKGPLKTYHAILSVFREVEPELKIDWTALVAVSVKDKLIQGLRELQQRFKSSFSGRRITNQSINHRYIDDAYIYQIK
ncbi:MULTISPECIES: hypothetical protein [unclassified Microcoleus]|uniref:hypothetical protein n=1 Tax=unclassified Microcoleus TaxID=2642155 RepID=UPI0025FD0764|nr:MULTISPECIES: hypothetical protein [unclassified Microcoleus]